MVLKINAYLYSHSVCHYLLLPPPHPFLLLLSVLVLGAINMSAPSCVSLTLPPACGPITKAQLHICCSLYVCKTKGHDPVKCEKQRGCWEIYMQLLSRKLQRMTKQWQCVFVLLSVSVCVHGRSQMLKAAVWLSLFFATIQGLSEIIALTLTEMLHASHILLTYLNMCMCLSVCSWQTLPWMPDFIMGCGEPLFLLSPTSWLRCIKNGRILVWGHCFFYCLTSQST